SFFKCFAFTGKIHAALLGEDSRTPTTGLVLDVAIETVNEETVNDIVFVGEPCVQDNLQGLLSTIITVPLKFFIPFRAYFMNVSLGDFKLNILRRPPSVPSEKAQSLVLEAPEFAHLTRSTPMQDLTLKA